MEYAEELKNAENSLRDLIARMLEDSFGKKWIDKCGVTQKRIDKWRERKVVESKRQKVESIEERLIYYSDFYDLRPILKKHWTPIFSPVFKQWKILEVFLLQLEDFRDPEAHGRELLLYQKNLIMGISGWIRNHIVLYRSNLLDKDGYFPQIESVRDNFGNIWTSQEKIHSVQTNERLFPNDKIDFELIASDPLDGKIYYQLSLGLKGVGVFWQPKNRLSYVIKKEDIGRFAVSLQIKSNRDYTFDTFYDDYVNFEYIVLPDKK